MDRLVSDTTALLVVDVQERLAGAMQEGALARLVRNVSLLLDAAKILGLRVVASEQYPKGLGPTIPEIAQKLLDVGVAPLPKVTFDACGDLGIARALSDAGPRSVIVAGMETHVCVFQTARELVKRGYATHVAADAVASRSEDNRALGLALCERAGAFVVPTETIVFDLLERAGTDAFRALSKLLK